MAHETSTIRVANEVFFSLSVVFSLRLYYIEFQIKS